ncbi:hypothetical protein CRG98_011843 [Punica granatum]|uniref:(-)-germacrene D synthase-like n=1 Tax=Punica granatum TaxID=22663 RepID=A0A2I0KH39_PUNGR|nr:hypothetical protein CRG98_011843 [Punica granatum]
MSIEDSLPSTLTSAQTGATHVVGRRSAGFHPSVWGDYFLNYTSGSMITDVRAEQHREKLKMEVKRMLTDADDDFDKSSDNKLYLIDQIQRLGIGYQFGREIAEVLEQIHSWYSNRDHADYADDLCTAARMFRLLRQQGFRISCDIFDKFKDSNGEFSESLVKDVRGLLSLYEASHFRVNGEDILEEALSFTIHHLRSAVEIDDPKLNRNLVTEVKHALKRSLRKGLVRLDAWHYIKLYEEDASHSEVLLELAKLDFNCLQKFHQKELSEITRQRVKRGKNTGDVTPNVSISVVVDPVGRSLPRWDIGAIDELPQYMQIFYKALLDTYEEFEKTLAKQGRTYRLFYAKEAMKNQAKVYFKEATWFHQNYTPTLEEYMPLAMETTAYGMLATASFLGMGDVASKDAFEWLLSDPKILRGSMIVCRLMDDIVSHKVHI